MAELRHLGGALSEPQGVPNSVGHRGGVATVYVTAYPAPENSPPGVAAEYALIADLAPWSDGGALVNFLAGLSVTRTTSVRLTARRYTPR